MKGPILVIYEVVDNTPNERKWTYAISIHPRSRLIAWSCPDCGTTTSYPAGSFDITIEGGGAYPDILGCGSYPFLILSKRVIDLWENHNFGTFIKYPVSVTKALETDLSPARAPQYFRIEVVGNAKIDMSASCGKIKQLCYRCGTFRTEPIVIKKFAFLPRSWDGSAVFRDQLLYPNVIFCTDAVKRLTEHEKHSNFHFEEMLSMSEAL